MPAPPATSKHSVVLESEKATAELGAVLALFLKPGDLLALSGELGAGKTTLARSAIRALAPRAGEFEVPSPTFTLVQSYDFTRVPVSHFDLYRMSSSDELIELGFDDALRHEAILVEWPDRMSERLPDDRLDVSIAYADGAGSRRAILTGHGAWACRLQRMVAIADFVARSGWGDAARTHLQGDASARRYERLIRRNGEKAILMDMPASADEVPVRGARSYSELVHLAVDIRPVVAMTHALRGLGLAAPEIYHVDLDVGVALIEDLGDATLGTLYADGSEIEEAYRVACDVLVHIAQGSCPRKLHLPDGTSHDIQDFDRNAWQAETGLLLDWFWSGCTTAPVTSEIRREFEAAWDEVLGSIDTRSPVWMLRDFHSPNLLWLPHRQGLSRLGLIDYQDIVMGHSAYDLAALLQDARIDVSPERERRHFERYVQGRRIRDGDFDEARFASAYAIFGAQRCTKILGIFARLNRRDGKPGYLHHIPRVSGYLERNLDHQDLGRLRAWFDEHLPSHSRSAGELTGA